MTVENKGEILIYESADNGLDIQVRLENDTLWLSQRLMAEFFEKDSDTIGLHIKNIFAEGELDERATTEFFSAVQMEGNRQVSRQVKFYNLDVIISVGYRVNSKRGAQFRIWATQRLKDYLLLGELNQTYPANDKAVMAKAYDVGIVRQTYPNAYRSRTPEDDERLLRLAESGVTTSELAHTFLRNKGAIRSRLKKLMGE